MQLNNPKNNTSNLIKQSELAKKKARRRLIGSIFMLLTALIILLNVTAKVKPIPVNPKVIEISNNTSAPAKTTSQSQIVNTASAPINASSPVTTNAIAASNTESSGTGFKAGVVGTNGSAKNDTESGAVTIKPIIITMNIDHKPSPEDILNGNLSKTSETIYYVQIAASTNKPELIKIQNSLSGNGIKSFIQNGKNNNYRLRAGAFKSKPEATDKLAQIRKSLNQ
ncbi:MAG: hypothetical protein K0R14_825 [Burkholderiales bacterium]|jgi:cell division septation protein DedD|nr:hypothetical protein [Burkholderiales bacterium]